MTATQLEHLADCFQFVARKHKWEPGAKDIAWEWAREHPFQALKIYGALRRSY